MLPPLYHWSPRDRRRSIEHRGLVPGCRAVDGDWRPNYVCLAENPGWAWALSGELHPEIGVWDLWQVWLGPGHQLRRMPNSQPRDDRRWKEVRVFDRIYKRGVLWVAERTTR